MAYVQFHITSFLGKYSFLLQGLIFSFCELTAYGDPPEYMEIWMFPFTALGKDGFGVYKGLRCLWMIPTRLELSISWDESRYPSFPTFVWSYKVVSSLCWSFLISYSYLGRGFRSWRWGSADGTSVICNNLIRDPKTCDRMGPYELVDLEIGYTADCFYFYPFREIVGYLLGERLSALAP